MTVAESSDGSSDEAQAGLHPAVRQGSDVAALYDVAYQGGYHDAVVAALAAHWRAGGATVLTAVDLIARNGATARADMLVVPPSGEPLILVEVKTGDDPQYTGGQRIVYPMAQIGGHVNSPNSKIIQLGFLPGEWLPPMELVTIYKKNARSKFRWLTHPDPIVR